MANTAHRPGRVLRQVLAAAIWLALQGFGPDRLDAAPSLSRPPIGRPSTMEQSADASWPMAGGNVERTSWTIEEVRGKLRPVWYRPIEPYIPAKAQIIAANGLLYIATARGLYALDAGTGAQAWVYPTELPLGQSPTVSRGVAYVGGFDKKLHAINARTGERLWTFEAGAGFDTNPLVVNGKVYVGNRDGYMYAIHDDQSSERGQLAWRYQTGGPINMSAAYKDGVVYFVSEDAHAYALNAESGALVWQSAKLPGGGFRSWWPVVYGDTVIIPGQTNYRSAIEPGPDGQWAQSLDMHEVFPNHGTEPQGTLVGPRGSDGWIDATRITEYLEAKPWRRTYVVLNRANGAEVTYDYDGDGKADYAPILWHGTHDGSRYPAVVGVDNNLYQANNYMSDVYINGGQVTGWQPGTKYISTPSSVWIAVDEPLAYAAGGRLIYWSHLGGASAGAFDITMPNTRGEVDASREWVYWAYNLGKMIPGYDALYGGEWGAYRGLTGSKNGPYSGGGDQTPPIPYRGKVYVRASNAIVALADTDAAPVALPVARTVGTQDGYGTLGTEGLKRELADEVQKMLQAGHLRPGYRSSGLVDPDAKQVLGDNLMDYWHEPGDTLYTLLRALPYLPEGMQGAVKGYLQKEYTDYPPYKYSHIGWRDGAPREAYTLPPEVDADRASFGPTQWTSFGFQGWGEHYGGTNIPPSAFYAMWKYAQVFGNARQIFDASRSVLSAVPADSLLVALPHVHNAYIAGYWGYLELEKLAGYPEEPAKRAELDRLLRLRAETFATDTPDIGDSDYSRTLRVAKNFMGLVPELAGYLRANALGKVQAAVSEYEQVEPYWFVSKYEDSWRESSTQPLYDHNALFQAKALILQEPQSRLERYIETPAFAVGDLFYIQNLVSAIEAPGAAN